MVDLQYSPAFLVLAKITGSFDYDATAGYNLCIVTASIQALSARSGDLSTVFGFKGAGKSLRTDSDL
ncbi:hypothetical protein YC2023_052769 [Brassica napus]